MNYSFDAFEPFVQTHGNKSNINQYILSVTAITDDRFEPGHVQRRGKVGHLKG